MIKCVDSQIIKNVVKNKENVDMLNEYSNIENDLNRLLDQIGNAELSRKIRNVISKREDACSYAWYNQGLYKGIKSALIIKKKNLNPST